MKVWAVPSMAGVECAFFLFGAYTATPSLWSPFPALCQQGVHIRPEELCNDYKLRDMAENEESMQFIVFSCPLKRLEPE